ncbi:MAG: response regulator transcription factor [Flavobacteriaceae bacterium]|nr:response regulator transcription factor [Flavobacteriaceae bacterium]
MKKEVNILIIDNRPILVQGLKFIFQTNFNNCYRININSVCSYEKAVKIMRAFLIKKVNIDVIFLNIDINNVTNYGLLNTKDYIEKIKSSFPFTKIILITNRKDNYRIYSIIKIHKPLGFILENETTFDELIKLFIKIFNSKKYYSKTINSIVSSFKNQFLWIDEIDYHILYFLKQGIKLNKHSNYLPLTHSAIEKRKYKLKDILAFKKCTDDQLIEEAIKRRIL